MRRFPLPFEECLAAIGKDPGPACLPSPSFSKLPRAKAGDWLAEHPEKGQTYSGYRRSITGGFNAGPPRPKFNVVVLVPLGKSFEGFPEFLGALATFITAYYLLPVVTTAVVPLVKNSFSSRENEFGNRQYLIGDMFTMMAKCSQVRAVREQFCILGVTLEDIYPGDSWNYVFGQARMMDRVGVFSFARHHPEFYNGVHAKNSKLGGGEMVSWWLDCVRTCLHELGHLLGMRHCIYFRCLMNGNNGPGDSAGRTTFLCPVCLRKVLSVCAGDECGTAAVAVERYKGIIRALDAVPRDLLGPGTEGGVTRGLRQLQQWAADRVLELDVTDVSSQAGQRLVPVQVN